VRIAHVSDCYLPRLGGIEWQVHDLAQRQAAAGHDVTVITSTAGSGSDSTVVGGTVVRVGGTTRKPETIRYRRSARGPRMIEAGKFDVVHVHASAFSPLAFLTARRAARLGIPTVATLHSLWAGAAPLFHAADRLTGWASWPVEWSAVSNVAAGALRRVLRSRAGVSVLPNGVAPETWVVEPVPGDPGELRVTAVMRLAHRKRPLQLAEILRKAQEGLPTGCRMHVKIIGDGPEKARLERYLRRHGMSGWVSLPGRLSRDDIRSAFARSDVFVAPASLESFGIAALEARCAGLPIVALSGTGVQDFITHDVDGWLVGSDEAMAETIAGLAVSREALDRVKAHNRSVPPSVTWSSVLESCDSLYESAARRQGRTPLDDRRPDVTGEAALSH
jgi:glycosyltransferase involved in cell wall biosynthesis